MRSSVEATLSFFVKWSPSCRFRSDECRDAGEAGSADPFQRLAVSGTLRVAECEQACSSAVALQAATDRCWAVGEAVEANVGE